MNVLQILLRSAEADVRYALWWHDRSGDADWLELARKAEAQAADFRATLASRVFA